MSDTLETDAALYPINGVDIVWPEFSRQLERERDEARHKYNNLATEHMLAVNKLANERDDARQLADRLTALELQSTSELARLERESNEAREALMKIEDLFIDGTDIYADRETMGIIAREALEETK